MHFRYNFEHVPKTDQWLHEKNASSDFGPKSRKSNIECKNIFKKCFYKNC